MRDFDDLLDEFLEGTGWEGDDATLTCPDGQCVIEHDCSSCNCGHLNPLTEAGLI